MSICVQKDGKLFTVQLDSSNQAMAVTTYDERPAGAFPATFFSLREVQAKCPGRELTIVERPPGGGTRIEKDPAVAAEPVFTRRRVCIAPFQIKEPMTWKVSLFAGH